MSLPKSTEMNVSEFIKDFMSHEDNVKAYPDGWDRFIFAIKCWNHIHMRPEYRLDLTQ